MVRRAIGRCVYGGLVLAALVSIVEAGQGSALADAAKRGDRSTVRALFGVTPRR